MQASIEKRSRWLDRPLVSFIAINWETILFATIMVVAIFSRLYILGARVQSHDENTHVYYSWRFYKGQGFAHDPLMHGPLQFHLIALTYFMFGDNDFTARLPAALFSIATVGFMWAYRRYLGKAGALVAAVLMLISPYMLYYGRYARNEAFVGLFGVITIWAILRFLETGEFRYTYWLTAATVLHFASKETSFIYTAQAMVFLALYFIFRIARISWPHPERRNGFLISLILTLLLWAGAGGYLLRSRSASGVSPTETMAPSVPGQELGALPTTVPPALVIILILFSILTLCAAAYFLIRGYTWARLRQERSLGLIILLGTFVLPQLAAFPVRFMGWDIPTNASEVMALTTTDILHIAVFVVPLAILSVVIGLLWNRREWLINAGIFWGLFTVFYTSVFTNGAGFFTGLVGSLGYWLEQQGVQRGSQPWYYYGLVQVPIYEYLPALGTWLAFILACWEWLKSNARKASGVNVLEDQIEDLPAEPPETTEDVTPVFPLLGFWAVTSMLAYSAAGEKMPWLTVHITLPAILCAAWVIGRLIDEVDWQALRERRAWLVLILLPVFLLSFLAALGALLGATPPFKGKELVDLQATSTFLTSFLVAVGSGIGLVYLIKDWSGGQFIRLLWLYLFAFLGFLTARSAFLASYINYDYANELLVYAHSAPGVKVALSQIEEISRRTTDGLGVVVAYDNATSYPYWWYLRNYPNARYYGSDPTRTLRDAPLILVGDENYAKIEPVVANLYDRFDYIRLWWPNQDYFGLTWQRIRDALTDPEMRSALFQIWLNRDYTKYGQVLNKDMGFPTWTPSAGMRLYIRKDLISQLWNYGAAPSPEAVQVDPFEEKHIVLAADAVLGSPGAQPGEFQHPRDLAVAPDGSLYVVDTDNHRIQHLAADGKVLDVWGSFGDATTGPAPGGTFNQPWGIGLAPDGSVYVADTWNHRIQKFNPDGEFVTMWGSFGQAERPDAFWGPRDVAVDANGNVFITDTGNKRVVIFDEQGQFINQFGSAGMGVGQLDEPVGLVIDKDGLVYVADTWNQRIQVFSRMEDGSYSSLRTWDLLAWYGQSLDNKPYLGVDDQVSVFVADPEGYRILQFTSTGEAIRSWGDFGASLETFGMPASVAWDLNGGVWVTDAANGRIMHFTLPGP